MIRVSLGVTSLFVSILFAANALGIVPDRDRAVLRGRQTLSEAVAIHCSLALQNDNLPMLDAATRGVVERDPDLLSLGVRDASGKLLVEAGDHEEAWQARASAHSTPTHVRVPLFFDGKPRGAVELRFRPLHAGSFNLLRWSPIFPLAGFMLAVGLIAVYGYLRAVLRRADPSRLAIMPERVRATLNTVAEGVLVLDKDQRIALANEAFARTFGQPPEELQGRKASDLPWTEDRPRSGPEDFPWARAVREGVAQTGCILGLRTHRIGLRRVSVNSTPIVGDDGTCKGALATFDDLTPVETRNARLRKAMGRLRRERRKVRRQKAALLRAKQKAEAASRAKSEFLANVSHEIRTPMNAILGMTDVVIDSGLAEAQREYLEVVRSSAHALLTIINDLLDFSKIEAGKFTLDLIDFDLREAVGDTLKTLALRAHKKGLELACDIHSELPEVLVGDPGRLRQILVNLVGNALKFTERGEVVLEIRATEACADKADTAVEVHFLVRDTGIGIPEGMLGSIFAPFVQADGSTTRKYGGTGLGLSISSHLVALMGGRIWVESEVGQGSTFHFTARFGLRRDSRASFVLPHLPSLRGLAVLVVDDNATSRGVLEGMLRPLGMEPTAVNSTAALEAVARAEADGRPFAVALVDASAPEGDNFFLAEQLRQHGRLAAATVMLLSTANQQRDASRCRQAGLGGHVTKPLKKSEVHKAILRVLALPATPARVTEQGSATRPAAEPEAVFLPRLRILLVDDNEFNQKVGTLKLEGKGHAVRVAGSGREALAALDEQPFDLVLMDMQMPDMDGIEATAAIRAKEKRLGRRIPVIAVTGRAMKGDRERCLQAGMDGYVAKPIDDRELWQAMRSALSSQPAAAEPGPATAVCPSRILDERAVLGRVGGKITMLRKLAVPFRSDCARLTAALRDALGQGNAERVRQDAHTIKGMVSFFGVPTATEAALELETMGRLGNLGNAGEPLAVLVQEIEKIQVALSELCESPEDPGAGEAQSSAGKAGLPSLPAAPSPARCS